MKSVNVFHSVAITCANVMFMIQQAVHDLGVQYESVALICMFLMRAINIYVSLSLENHPC